MAQLQGVGLGTPKLTEPNPTQKLLIKESHEIKKNGGES